MIRSFHGCQSLFKLSFKNWHRGFIKFLIIFFLIGTMCSVYYTLCCTHGSDLWVLMSNCQSKPDCGSGMRCTQKIQKLSESPTTTPIVAKLCGINCKNRKITNKLKQLFNQLRQGVPKMAILLCKNERKSSKSKNGLKLIRKW